MWETSFGLSHGLNGQSRYDFRDDMTCFVVVVFYSDTNMTYHHQMLGLGDTIGFYDIGVNSSIFVTRRIEQWTDDYRKPLVLDGDDAFVLRRERWCCHIRHIRTTLVILVLHLSFLYYICHSRITFGFVTLLPLHETSLTTEK